MKQQNDTLYGQHTPIAAALIRHSLGVHFTYGQPWVICEAHHHSKHHGERPSPDIQGTSSACLWSADPALVQGRSATKLNNDTKLQTDGVFPGQESSDWLGHNCLQPSKRAFGSHAQTGIQFPTPGCVTAVSSAVLLNLGCSL